jgi:hypothetical protein
LLKRKGKIFELDAWRPENSMLCDRINLALDGYGVSWNSSGFIQRTCRRRLKPIGYKTGIPVTLFNSPNFLFADPLGQNS